MKKKKAAATVDSLRKGVIALSKAKVEAGKRFKKFQPQIAGLIKDAEPEVNREAV